MTPWSEMLQAAARMGITPEAFWRLSFREWRMLTMTAAASAPIGRADFERLSELWPDKEVR